MFEHNEVIEFTYGTVRQMGTICGMGYDAGVVGPASVHLWNIEILDLGRWYPLGTERAVYEVSNMKDIVSHGIAES